VVAFDLSRGQESNQSKQARDSGGQQATKQASLPACLPGQNCPSKQHAVTAKTILGSRHAAWSKRRRPRPPRKTCGRSRITPEERQRRNNSFGHSFQEAQQGQASQPSQPVQNGAAKATCNISQMLWHHG